MLSIQHHYITDNSKNTAKALHIEQINHNEIVTNNSTLQQTTPPSVTNNWNRGNEQLNLCTEQLNWVQRTTQPDVTNNGTRNKQINLV